MIKILIVDDCPVILEANLSHLTDEGFNVTAVDTGTQALECLKENQYDCVVMDIMLPDIDGFSLCKSARDFTSAPIIFLSSMDEDDDKIKGLMIGGDDYITKPYNLQELSARIRVLLRREQQNKKCFSFGEVSIDMKKRVVTSPDKRVLLSQKEFELFILLFENPHKKFSKDDVFKAIWPDGADIGTVAVHIMKLRRKLDFAKNEIGTIENDYKLGYYFLRKDTPLETFLSKTST